jgi:uncharacterized protein
MPTIEFARLCYPASDPVHGFDHVLRVYALAERLARHEGADLEIVRAAVLLHDASSASPLADSIPLDSGSLHNGPLRSDHHISAADFARQVLQEEGWPPERIAAVQHCIRAHRFRDDREPPETLEARILFDADKLDAIGAIGVARAIAFSVRAGQPFFAPPSARYLDTGELEPGEPHSAYHEYLFKLRKLKDRLFTPSARRLALERHRFMEQYFERLVAEVDASA